MRTIRPAAPANRLTELPRFTARDRVLVTAPHPDDESIATGGVLQAARAAGADCRVLVVTDGDNNPWPQRWIEKRWHLGAADRARWGARRRAEALSALAILGVAARDVRCLGYPDLGLTDLLIRGDRESIARLRDELSQFRPTRVFLPALEDRHPDHSAVHVMMRLALADVAEPAPQLFSFGVHGARKPADAVVLTLDEHQRATKRQAIMQHGTQMRLSERRFVGYAAEQEPFRSVAAGNVAAPMHPLQAKADATNALGISVDLARWKHRLRGMTFFIVAQMSGSRPLRRQVALSGPGRGQIIDTVAQRCVGEAVIERAAERMSLRLATPERIERGWIKLARPAAGLFVFDHCGWQAIATDESRG